jgi:hypothetical protein
MSGFKEAIILKNKIIDKTNFKISLLGGSQRLKLAIYNPGL